MFLVISSYCAEFVVNLEDDDWFIQGYYEQTFNLKWTNESGLGALQSLFVPEIGILINKKSDLTSFFLDLSIDAQIYDIHNISFAPNKLNINKLYLNYKTDFANDIFPKGIELQIGRDELCWGPSYKDSLILSDHIKKDMVKYSGFIDLKQLGFGDNNQIYFTKVLSMVDNGILSGQRFDYSPNSNWNFGLSETMLLHQGLNFFNFNPIPVPFVNFFTSRCHTGPAECYKIGENGDSIYSMGLDVLWSPEKNKEIDLYGEILLYNLPFWEESKSLQGKYGLTIGGSCDDIFGVKDTDFRLEYTRIQDNVYYSVDGQPDYYYQDIPIGHELGPDATQLFLQVQHQLTEEISVGLSYTYRIKREKNYIDILEPPIKLADIKNSFYLPSTAEYLHCFSASIAYDLNKDCQVEIIGLLKNYFNKDNQPGENLRDIEIITEIKYEF